MPARSRWRQRRAFRWSYTFLTRRPHPPQQGISVVGSTSQTSPSCVSSKPVTRVSLIPSTVLSRVVAHGRSGSKGWCKNPRGSPSAVRVPSPIAWHPLFAGIAGNSAGAGAGGRRRASTKRLGEPKNSHAFVRESRRRSVPRFPGRCRSRSAKFSRRGGPRRHGVSARRRLHHLPKVCYGGADLSRSVGVLGSKQNFPSFSTCKATCP